jgi:hypothetical protein
MSEPKEQIRNIWISGLLDPSKVRVTERYRLYICDLEQMEEVSRRTPIFSISSFCDSI